MFSLFVFPPLLKLTGKHCHGSLLFIAAELRLNHKEDVTVAKEVLWYESETLRLSWTFIFIAQSSAPKVQVWVVRNGDCVIIQLNQARWWWWVMAGALSRGCAIFLIIAWPEYSSQLYWLGGLGEIRVDVWRHCLVSNERRMHQQAICKTITHALKNIHNIIHHETEVE